MNDPKILVSAKKRGGSAESGGAWTTLGWIGLVFTVVGGADFALVWYPSSFGSPEWEFGTVTQSLNGIPILLLGIGMLFAGSEQTGRRWWMYVGAGCSLLMLVWVVVGAGLWGLNVPMALQTVPDELALGVRKAIFKTSLQSVAYASVFAYLVRRAWRVAQS